MYSSQKKSLLKNDTEAKEPLFLLFSYGLLICVMSDDIRWGIFFLRINDESDDQEGFVITLVRYHKHNTHHCIHFVNYYGRIYRRIIIIDVL